MVRGIVVDNAAFETLMRMAKKQFNYLLVDSQRGMTSIDRTCMNVADTFILMVEMSVASAQNTARLIEFFGTDQPGKKIVIIANKMGMSSNGALSKESFEKVIDRKIDYILPFDENMTLAAANLGQPLAASNGPITDVLEAVVEDALGKRDHQEIIQEIQAKEPGGAKAKRIFFEAIQKIVSFVKK